MRSDTRVPLGRIGAGLAVKDELDIDVQHAQSLVAADVAGIRVQESVELVPASAVLSLEPLPLMPAAPSIGGATRDPTSPPHRARKNWGDPVANRVMETTNSALNNRVALVTGGGRGIGQAISLGLAELGARVAVLARSADQVRETAARITSSGGQALALPADVGDPDQVAAALDTIAQRWGEIQLLVNNAAVVWPLGPSATIDASQWATAIAINVTAAARLTFTVLPGMLAQDWGRIVNVSSGIAASPAAMLRANAYATSKAALEAHTLNLAAELAGTGVTVNVYRPGGVDTAMQAWIRKQDPEQIGATLHQRFTDNYQQGTLLTPAQSAVALLTRLASRATGQIWDVSDRQ